MLGALAEKDGAQQIIVEGSFRFSPPLDRNGKGAVSKRSMILRVFTRISYGLLNSDLACFPSFRRWAVLPQGNVQAPGSPGRQFRSAGSKTNYLSLFFLAIWLVLPNISPGQIPGEPDEPVITTPPQMMCLGNSLKAMRITVLEPHFAARHTITSLRFSQIISANGSDVYLGAVKIEGQPLPLALDSAPFLPNSSVVRWGYIHNNNSSTPDLMLDTFVMAQSPLPAGRIPSAIIGSEAELDLLLQVCDWMEEGQTPNELIPMRQWLQQDNTRIDGLRCWKNGKRVHLLLSGTEQATTGNDVAWRTEISWQPTVAGGFVDLEVQP